MSNQLSTKRYHGLLTRSSTKLLAPFPESGPNDVSVGSANCGTFFLCSNQGRGCPPFSELQQLSGCASLVLSRWNTVCTVFPEVSRVPGSVIQLPKPARSWGRPEVCVLKLQILRLPLRPTNQAIAREWAWESVFFSKCLRNFSWSSRSESTDFWQQVQELSVSDVISESSLFILEVLNQGWGESSGEPQNPPSKGQKADWLHQNLGRWDLGSGT